MENAAEILVIIVSVVLAVFLVIAIILAFLALKLVKQLKKVADHAERAVETVENAGELFKNTSGPLAVFKFARNLAKSHNAKVTVKKGK